MMHTNFIRRPFELIAYRGGATERPENTLLAFEHAVQCDANIILDLDLQLTADDRVVVFHDSTLDRTTNGSGRVSEHSLADLAKLNAAHHFQLTTSPNAALTAKIPTLRETLHTFPDTRFLLDIRRYDPEFIKRVTADIAECGADSRVIMMSESDRVIRALQRSHANLTCAAATNEVKRVLIAAKLGLGRLAPSRSPFFMVPEHHNGTHVLCQRFLGEMKRRRKYVFIWTVDCKDDVWRLSKLGVHGVFTNAPSKLAETVREINQQLG